MLLHGESGEGKVMAGNPDPAHMSTSLVERQNLTMRMNMRRYTRETDAFSKKIENHRHTVALRYMNYNFCRIHLSLGETPAMTAGIAERPMRVEEIAEMALAAAPRPRRPARYQRRGQMPEAACVWRK